MFDIGATEILVIAIIAIIVVGPKDLPVMLRKIGSIVSYAKKMSSDFQSHIKETVDDTVKDTGLGDIKNTVDDIKNYDWSQDDDDEANQHNEKIMRETNSTPKKKSTGKKTASKKRAKKPSAKGASS